MAANYVGTHVVLNIGLSAPTFLQVDKLLSHVERIAIIRKNLPLFMRVNSCKMDVVPRHVYGGEPVMVFHGTLCAKYESALFETLVEAQQDCCAMLNYGSNTGQLFGPHADKWGSFNPQFFVL